MKNLPNKKNITNFSTCTWNNPEVKSDSAVSSIPSKHYPGDLVA